MDGKTLVGREAIAEFLGWTLSKTVSKRREMREAGKILDALKGRPPHRRRIIYTFPLWLMLWLSRSNQGE